MSKCPNTKCLSHMPGGERSDCRCPVLTDQLLTLVEAAREFTAAVQALNAGEHFSVSRYRFAQVALLAAALRANGVDPDACPTCDN